ncbi:MAG: ABC transporter ATP-binding protein [Acidobacteria bacterium]|nr:ABC transporter ATP-binding protein [Acidobacteriota bacterium]
MGILGFERAGKDYVTDGQTVTALRDVSLEIAAGSFVAVVGRSGCGKSTLLNLAGAMDFPSTGRVLVAGAATWPLSDTALTRLRREKVGFIFQSFQLLPAMSVVENVELPLLLAGVAQPRQTAIEALWRVEIVGFEERMPFQLSGGQMQRVAIARALVNRPRILLADEPTGNLDSTNGDKILKLLRKLVDDSGVTVLMATHSLEAAESTDTIVRLRDGRVEDVRETSVSR